MHSHSLDNWTHEHAFLGEAHAQNERRTWFVVAITVVALLMSFLATLYPAWRAARTQPAEALRYE